MNDAIAVTIAGTVRWAVSPLDHPGGTAAIEIDGTLYGVTRQADQAIRLENWQNGNQYLVGPSMLGCTCRDAVYRRRTCKHQTALRALLRLPIPFNGEQTNGKPNPITGTADHDATSATPGRIGPRSSD